MSRQQKPICGLVLTGGGARAAYQAGVLRGIAEILGPEDVPFRVIAGVSAGAINGTFLAAAEDPFPAATERLYEFWKTLGVQDVFQTNLGAFTRMSASWLRDLGLGGMLGAKGATHLLNATPLRAYLGSKIDFEGLQRNIEKKRLHAVAISATNYFSGTAVSFFDGHPDLEPWVRSWRLGQRASLSLDHVLASAAIPMLFAPIRIGKSYFGDGGIRLTAPLSPAIHLGADRVLGIGIRYLRSKAQTLEINATGKMDQISIADIAGVMMNAAFLDSLDTDAERMSRINQTMAMMEPDRRARHPHKLREVPMLIIRPSQDLGRLASDEFTHFPRTLRYFLKGLGASDEKGWDFLSYLAFDPAYCGSLLELGHRDALERRDEIESFFREDAAASE